MLILEKHACSRVCIFEHGGNYNVGHYNYVSLINLFGWLGGPFAGLRGGSSSHHSGAPGGPKWPNGRAGTESQPKFREMRFIGKRGFFCSISVIAFLE